MKSIIAAIIIAAVFTLNICLGEEKPATEISSEDFKIIKVMNEPKKLNALGKMSQFSDSNEVGKETELSKNLPGSQQGEEFIIKWRYSGKAALPQVTVKLEYVTAKRPQIHFYEKGYAGTESKIYQIVLKNVGEAFKKNGEIAHWRVTIQKEGKIVASKQSAMWSSFENYAKGSQDKN